jgi:hypothetical protein
MVPSLPRSTRPSNDDSSVPVSCVTWPPTARSTVIGLSTNFSSSLSLLTRSNWKFCSSTRVAGLDSDVNVTVVGSISPATSVNLSCERPRGSSMSRSTRTTAKPGSWLAGGGTVPGSGRYQSAGIAPGWAALYTVRLVCGAAASAGRVRARPASRAAGRRAAGIENLLVAYAT